MKVSQFSINPVVCGVIFLLLIPMMTQAETHVVTEGQSIGSALEISASGDSVLVGPGDYSESGLEMPSGVVLAALYPDLQEQPRLISTSGETILHCENLLPTTSIEGLIFTDDSSVIPRTPVRGQGIHVINSALTISHCSFVNLRASYGGAIYIGTGQSPEIMNCSFDSNIATGSGGAIALVGGQGLVLDHCLFEDNSAAAGGSVLNAAMQATAVISSCTLVGNGLAGMGDIQTWDSGLVEVANCIVATGNGRPCYGDFTSTPQIHCSDLTANAGGDWIGALAGQAEISGNISLEPMFCGTQREDGYYTIDESSPCTAEANPGCGLMGAFDIGCNGSTGIDGPQITPVEEDALPAVTRLRGNYPNPFNPQTTIAFDLSQPGQTSVDVYDLAGRLVRNLHAGSLEAGPHQVVWNGRGPDGRMSAAGIYFFRLKTETVIDTRRMMLVK